MSAPRLEFWNHWSIREAKINIHIGASRKFCWFWNGYHLSFRVHLYTIRKFWYFCTFSDTFFEKMAVYLHMHYFKSMLHVNFWFSACFCQHGPTRLIVLIFNSQGYSLILDTISYPTANSFDFRLCQCQKSFLKSENSFDFWSNLGFPFLILGNTTHGKEKLAPPTPFP